MGPLGIIMGASVAYMLCLWDWAATGTDLWRHVRCDPNVNGEALVLNVISAWLSDFPFLFACVEKEMRVMSLQTLESKGAVAFKFAHMGRRQIPCQFPQQVWDRCCNVRVESQERGALNAGDN